jgi:hypothetical protein
MSAIILGRIRFNLISPSISRYFVDKIPKSDKHMFDECPWPFTLMHAPFKFLKDRNTHVVAVWAVLMQLYSLFMKARVLAS